MRGEHTPPCEPQSDSASLAAITQRLCTHRRRGPLNRVDEALLLELITTTPACRDAALAALSGHHITDDPMWLTHGPNDINELKLALMIIDDLLAHCDSTSTPHIAAMRAWVLWASHRPVEALRTLATHSATSFGTLLQRTIAVTSPPLLTRKDEP